RCMRGYAFLRVTIPQMPSTISDPTIADNQADKDQNSVTPTLKMLCPIQPPTTAPSTHNSIGASQPPPRWLGLMVLAMAPAINPKTIQPITPSMMTPSRQDILPCAKSDSYYKLYKPC